eukprot:6679716-Pyramimonas_sp.AAC.1
MDIVESGVAFSSYTYGLAFSSVDRNYVMVPPDLEQNPPPLWTVAQKVLTGVLNGAKFDGIQFGNQCKRTDAISAAQRGQLITWNNSRRESYMIRDVMPDNALPFSFSGLWKDESFLLYYSYSKPNDEIEDTPEVDL